MVLGEWGRAAFDAGRGGVGGALPRRRRIVIWSVALLGGVLPVAAWAQQGPDPLAGLRPKGGAGQSRSAASVEPPPDGKARTGLFGVTAEGGRFVYVFDRSASMGGSGSASLRAVKAELRKSLDNLDEVHQFQIIFYNERPLVFNPSGVPGKLAFATRQTKERALRFLGTVVADGNTEHELALKQAIRMRPDVIFFLTDGDDPKLTRRQLDDIRRIAEGVQIHTIEFGPGPQPAQRSFLAVLAEENGGQYVYVDTTKLDGREE